MIQPKHPQFAAFLDLVLEGQPCIPAVRRSHDEKARLLAHGVPMLEVEGLTATLDDRDAGAAHLLFKLWCDTGYACLSMTELTSSYFVTAHDTHGSPLVPAAEVPFSDGLDPIRRVLHAFVSWAVAHAESSPPEPKRPRPHASSPRTEEFFDSDPRTGELVRKLWEGARRTPDSGDQDS